ncbi:hypothetical protein AAMO2058_001364400 [Amorphochlora amoebiformis]
MGCCSSDEGALVEYGPKKEKIATKRPPKLAPAPAPPTRSLAPAPISTPAPGITYRNEANLEPGLAKMTSMLTDDAASIVLKKGYIEMVSEKLCKLHKLKKIENKDDKVFALLSKVTNIAPRASEESKLALPTSVPPLQKLLTGTDGTETKTQNVISFYKELKTRRHKRQEVRAAFSEVSRQLMNENMDVSDAMKIKDSALLRVLESYFVGLDDKKLHKHSLMMITILTVCRAIVESPTLHGLLFIEISNRGKNLYDYLTSLNVKPSTRERALYAILKEQATARLNHYLAHADLSDVKRIRMKSRSRPPITSSQTSPISTEYRGTEKKRKSPSLDLATKEEAGWLESILPQQIAVYLFAPAKEEGEKTQGTPDISAPSYPTPDPPSKKDSIEESEKAVKNDEESEKAMKKEKEEEEKESKSTSSHLTNEEEKKTDGKAEEKRGEEKKTGQKAEEKKGGEKNAEPKREEKFIPILNPGHPLACPICAYQQKDKPMYEKHTIECVASINMQIPFGGDSFSKICQNKICPLCGVKLKSAEGVCRHIPDCWSCPLCSRPVAADDLSTHLSSCKHWMGEEKKEREDLVKLRQATQIHLAQCQKNALNYVRKAAKAASDKCEQSVLARFLRLGFKRKHFDAVCRYIRNDAPIIIHFKMNKVMKFFVKDTHYRNLFEIGTGGGSTDKKARGGWEKKIFNGAYEGAKPFDRPKYGVLNFANDPGGVKRCYSYGDSFLLLRNVRLRTTFTFKDTSCIKTISEMGTCEYYMHVLKSFTDGEIKDMVKMAAGKVWTRLRVSVGVSA